MSKIVVLAEKPSVGRDMARVLKCQNKQNGYFEGAKYIVTWALGHLVTLADPEAYDPKYKQWRSEDLPMLPDRLKTVVIRQTNRQFQVVKKLLNRKDVSQVIIATDAGREGELVARWIIEKTRINKPIKRLWISSVTDKAIQAGFRNLQPGEKYYPLYLAAAARSEADWYVGLNATRALTTTHQAQLSSGRVQTPTLAMVAEREKRMSEFKSQVFYGIRARLKNGLQLTWHDQNNQARIFDKAKAKQLLAKLEGKQAQIQSIKRSEKRSYAPPLHDLSSLQQEANRAYGFSGKQTLSIMQKLYEQHKVLTYPRTDSRFLSSDIVETLRDRVDACAVGEYQTAARSILKNGIKANQSFINDKKVTDHHAIIPTEEPVLLSSLDDRERKIYDLVVKRFLACLSAPYRYEQITVEAEINRERFSMNENHVIDLGWKAVYQDQEEESRLPLLKEGELLDVTVQLTEGETTPPERFTEGTLLQAMENPAKYIDTGSSKQTETLKQTGGLGTVATRADIIDKLFSSHYIESRGKYIYTTSKGRQLLKLVPADLRSPILTAEWEDQLAAIARGQLKKTTFINEMKQYTRTIVSQIKNSDHTFKHDNVTGTKCPSCGKLMLEVNGKRGRMLVCQDRECGKKKRISRTTNARCPKCYKKMELRGSGEGQTFSCKCGYREKLSAFQKRKSQNNQHQATRRDVNKYLKKNNEESFANTALADALKKLKQK
ncbi:DNA topoisomerase III [Amphibacillus xylanus]|uniref:DNA topoisomerase 3 n=1 Tax=Amphibacillus xylanus (strain ATCC 51415 / DSM 6626 / JCM 7361 / LMG 17667 / NBRC 15112 / Ep01) TaxID=698758 RepID=K0J4J8_AMPXN|nr:DNA topoisomerase III [Amphibacillus xylanus]BAM48232.1 DNA topoisomerase III [Amphibacillus xylanus NBRC 15112]